ncbi:MAG: hypothetical protein ACE5FD_00940 [Anaerolineae bacterium]
MKSTERITGLFTMSAICAAILAVAVAGSVSGAIVSDGSVFADEFNVAGLDAAKWDLRVTNATFTVDGGGVAQFIDFDPGAPEGDVIIVSKPTLNYGTMTEYAAEINFRVSNDSRATLNNDALNRQVSLLTGRSTGGLPLGGGPTRELAVVLLEGTTSAKFSLGWGIYFDNPGGPLAYTPITGAIDLDRDTFHKLVVHRRSNGTDMDIYLNDGLITTLSNLGNGMPEELAVGDINGDTGVIMQVDYVRLGAAVPEPATLGLVTCGVLMMLGAPRKRLVARR